MRFKILFFAFLHQFPISWCIDADIDLEGTFHIGKDLLSLLRITFPDVFQENAIKIGTSNKKIIMREFKPDDKLSYRADHQMDLKSNDILNNNHIETTTKETVSNKVLFSDIKSQLSTEGDLKLKTLGNKMKNHLNPTLDINDVLQNVTKSYVSDFNKYTEMITNQEVIHDIDREFYILDIVETSNKLFLNNSKTLFRYIISQKNSSLPSEEKTLAEEYQMVVVDEKKDNLKYVCQKAYICRPYPAYSDYVAELLNKILKLPNYKFQTIVSELKNILELKSEIFKALVGEVTARKVGLSSKYMLKSPQNSKKILSILKEVLIHKYKIYRSKDGEIKMRSKAVRILLDLIDKTFEILEDIVEIQFNNFKRGLKEWVKGESNDIKTTVTEFCNNFVEVLSFYWRPETKKEVKFIMEVIVTGTTRNNDTEVDDLFTKGSKFVRGDHIFANRNQLPALI